MKKEEIQNKIEELIKKTTIFFEDIIITEEENKNNELKTTWFEIKTKEPHYFLHNEGEALFALNHIARKIIEAKITHKSDLWEATSPTYGQIIIDINGFQKKKIENVKAMVHMMAERARYFKSNIEIDPMPAYERRIVHEFLSNSLDLKTESEGFGRSRRVIIKYVGAI